MAGARPAEPWRRKAPEVAAELGTDARRGLSRTEAERRLARFGPNELAAAEPVPAWRALLAQLADPLVYLLGAAAAASLWLHGWRMGAMACRSMRS